MLSQSNIKALITSLERKNGLSGSVDNDDIQLGRTSSSIIIQEDTVVKGRITGISSLFISGNTILQGPITGISSLFISGNTILQGPITGISSLFISGNTRLQGPVTNVSSLNVSGVTTINNTFNALEIKQQYSQHYSGIPQFDLLIPTGSIISFAGNSAPNGWLLCDGTSYDAISSPVYNNLYNVITTIYGGTGSNNFQVPNIKGRVIVGRNPSDVDPTNNFSSLNNTGGAKTHTLTISEMPSHQHEMKEEQVAASGFGTATVANNDEGTGGTEGTLTGGGQPHNNVQPYIVLNYIIKY
jgi:microcystin-dependent protein